MTEEKSLSSSRSTSPLHLTSTTSSDSIKFQKCLHVEHFATRVKAIAYNEADDILSVGLADGFIVSFGIHIASVDDEEVKEWSSPAFANSK